MELEEQRLEALRSFQIFATPAEEPFDDFTRWISHFMDVPMAVMSFVDRTRAVVKSQVGFPYESLPRSEALHQYALQGDGSPVIVPDASLDPRFRDSPLVTGPAGIRYYAAVPLITPEGDRIGLMWVADRKLRPDLGAEYAETLRDLCRALIRALLSRRHVANLMFHQELNAEVAAAGDFQTALETMLARAGERVGALYCLVPQLHEDEAYYNFIAGVAIQPEFTAVVAEAVAPQAIEVARFSNAEVFTEQRVSDTGVVTEDMLSRFTPAGVRFFRLGARRQIGIPLTLGQRRAAVLMGFARHHISVTDRDFLSNLVAKLVPLLLGRLREEEIKRQRLHADYVNRAMRTLIGANQSLATASTELELIQTICKIAVTQGGYSAAWVGFAEQDEARSIRVIAYWGSKLEKLGTLPLTWADTPHGRGASGTAVRENRLVTMHNIARDPRIDPFRDNPVSTIFGSCIAVPLRTADGCSFGVFTLYNAAREEVVRRGVLSFDREEEELLTELARDIVNGINMIRDRDARNEALRKQRESDVKLANLLASSPTVLFSLEHDGKIWRNGEITQNFERVTGYAADEVRADHWWKRHIHVDDYAPAAAALRRVRNTLRETFQFRLRHPDGGYRWIRTELELQPATADAPERIVGAWSDITEKQEAQNEIHRLAFYDQLTGLPNRQHFHDRLRQTVADARQQHCYSALLFIDLDRFKSINDVHGHAMGDHVLVAVGDKLLQGVRASDTVARLGGDEFVVLLPKLGDDAEGVTASAVAVAEKLAAAVDRQMLLEDVPLRVTASIGIYVFSGKDDTLEKILRSADRAMYAAKSITQSRAWAGHSNISVFEAAMQDKVTHYHAVQSEIKIALAERRLELWLQPQVDAKGATIGAEALIRLRRANGSLLQPCEFITEAEDTGLIVPLGQWVRAEACRLLACYSPARLPRLSVNVSAIEFRQPRIVEDFLALLHETAADPNRLTLEITENLLIDRFDETIAKLEKLAAAGITISIDDFGTGYSSLGYLQRLPIREIKIDKSFISGMLSDRRSAELTQTLIMLAKNFNFGVVAEGVETHEQAKFLRRHGCLFMQGYLFGKPRPAEEFNSAAAVEGFVNAQGAATGRTSAIG